MLSQEGTSRGGMRRFFQIRFVRECLIVLAFCLFTALLTWPYVTRLRDAVAEKGDPYLISWILWWDYHQTFTDPLHLFNANLFYPLKYTLTGSSAPAWVAGIIFAFVRCRNLIKNQGFTDPVGPKPVAIGPVEAYRSQE